MMKTACKALSVMLSICLACLMTPFTAFGDEGQNSEVQEGNMPALTTASAKDPVSYREYTATMADGKATLTYEDRVCTNYLSIREAEVESDVTYLEDDCWYVVDCNFEANKINVGKNVRLILLDGFTLTCKPENIWYNASAVAIPDDSTLTIYGQENGTGRLIAPSNDEDEQAAIEVCGELNIHGGIIEATGGKYAAGIGLDKRKNSPEIIYGTINIYGGTVTATGGKCGAGIGGGYGATTEEAINIYGGNITAQGGDQAAGIGGGSYETDGGAAYAVDCCGVSIYGGTINATGGNSAAGIGSGYKNNLAKLTIAGGDITAQGGDYAAGIGAGERADDRGGDAWGITISGGTIKATAGEEYNDGEFGTAGIGGGAGGSLYGIDITGGDITAIGGKGTGRGCGIGGCYGKSIAISGGTVHAESSPHRGSAAIGCEYGYNNYSINISGGYVNALSHYNGAAIGSGSWAPDNANSYVKITGGTVIAETNADDDSPSTCTALGVGLRNGGTSGAGTLAIAEDLSVFNATTSPYTAITNTGGDMVSAMTGIEKVIIKQEIVSKGVATLYGERTSVQSDEDITWVEATGVTVTISSDTQSRIEFQRKMAKELFNFADTAYERYLCNPDSQISMSVTVYTAKITDAAIEADGLGSEFSLRAVLTATYVAEDGEYVDTQSHTLTEEDFAAVEGVLHVTIQVPEGKTVTDILHTSDDGTVVYDHFTADGTTTFSYDAETNTVSVDIKHCSHLIVKAKDATADTAMKATTVAATGDATPVVALACAALLAGACAAFARRKAMR